MNKSCKLVTQIPTLLRSLSALVTFRLGNRIDLDVDRQILEVRSSSRDCLEQDKEIYNGLHDISEFLRQLHEGRTWLPSFQPLPLLARRSIEQIEEEGANEELEAQMNNKGMNGYIMDQAKGSKAATLNHFIRRR
ncbi:MAG: hypothetical protein EZS28_037842 [Streblomastix strix]|uniref:Uncharacterized protein n=1 Tax=Streblomastix strix TaxID=222440 RepID=A0A5J4U8V5_9EUKA|nr:MAG: hypothetical protein EZS28_037842 [Streblomastix strix]